MQKVIVSLSGGEVNALTNPGDVEVEVRQYHADFVDHDLLREDPAGGRYVVIAHSRPNGAETVELIAEALRKAAAPWDPSQLEQDGNGPPMDTSDYDGRAFTFTLPDVDGFQIRVVIEDVTPDSEWRD